MKITSAATTPFFFHPAANVQRRSVRRHVAVRAERPASIESSDELAHKQEVVCGAILGISLMASVVLSFWQLAVA